MQTSRRTLALAAIVALFSSASTGCKRGPAAESTPAPSATATQDPAMSAQKDAALSAEIVVTDRENGEIRALKLKPGVKVTRDEFFFRYGSLLHLGKDDKMVELPPLSDGPFRPASTGYAQHYKGVPVTMHRWVVREKDGFVTSANGSSIPGLDLEVTPRISEKEALTKAMATVGARRYAWEDSSGTVREPSGKLGIVSADPHSDPKSFRAAYRFDISSSDPRGRYIVDVDVSTGSAISQQIPLVVE